MSTQLAPIVLFVFNRPNHARKTLEALAANHLAENSTLYIYADGPKENTTKEGQEKIDKTRSVLREKKWCKEVIIIESDKNKGLANSVIYGVTKVVNQFGKVIVLEDDLVTSSGFLKYMNDALILYENQDTVMQISGFAYPVKANKKSAYFVPLTTSWGWGTWNRAWSKFDPFARGYEELKINKQLSYRFNLNGIYDYTSMLLEQMEGNKINSWAIRWWWTVFKVNGIVLYPDRSLILNIGFGEESTHTKNVDSNTKTNFIYDHLITKFPASVNSHAIFFEKVKLYIKSQNNKDAKLPRLLIDMFTKVSRKIKNRVYYFIKKNLYSKFLNLIDANDIQLLLNEAIIRKCDVSVIKGNSSKFYEQARIFNHGSNIENIKIGNNCHIRAELVVFNYGGEIIIGDNTYIGENTKVWSGEKIKIGNSVLISHSVNIMDTTAHEFDHIEREMGFKNLIKEGHPKTKGSIKTAPIEIHDNVWINFGVTILKGVKINKGAIIGANSVVTKDVPPFTLVIGNPAKFVRNVL